MDVHDSIIRGLKEAIEYEKASTPNIIDQDEPLTQAKTKKSDSPNK